MIIGEIFLGSVIVLIVAGSVIFRKEQKKLHKNL